MKKNTTNGIIQSFYCEDEKIIVNIYDKTNRKQVGIVLERKMYDHWCGDFIRKGIEVEMISGDDCSAIKRIKCRQTDWFLTEEADNADIKGIADAYILNGKIQEMYCNKKRIGYIVYDKESKKMRTIYFNRQQFEKNGGDIGKMSSKVRMCMDKSTKKITKVGFVREISLPTGIRNKAKEYHFENDFA